MSKQTTVAIIGPGNLGIGLISTLSDKYKVIVGARNINSAKKQIKSLLKQELEVFDSISAAQQADVVLLTVNDSSIETVAKQVAPVLKKQAVLAHCSGSLDSDILKQNAANSFYVASVHPLNTFPNPAQSIQLLSNTSHGSFVFCEGDEQALQVLTPLFEAIHFKARIINKESKPLYHAAAVFACNYLVTLMDASLTTAELADIDRDDYWQAIQPMLASTLNNINQKGTQLALSGPIARGDIETVEKHLEVLKQRSPDIKKLYKALAKQTELINTDNS